MTVKNKTEEPKKEKVEPTPAPNDDLSEEDKRLQEELNMLVEKLVGNDVDLYLPALQMLSNLIRTSTTSMTSVPKPLKFLREHYPALKQVYEKIQDEKTKKYCADVVSVLAMGVSGAPDAAEKRECLKYCMLGTLSNVGEWGHEYVRQLEGEIAEEWNLDNMNSLMPLVCDVVAFDMKHSAEIQACDLLMEIDQLDILSQHMDQSNYPRVCLYLIGCASYVVEPESTQILQGVLDTYLRFGEYPRALLVAMQLHNKSKCEEVFNACNDPLIKKQLCYMLARQYVPLELEDEDLRTILLNAHINDHFLSLARELDIMEPKTPEEVYKTWLESAGSALRPSLLAEHPVDSARQNLSATFVNAFVNAGFGRDKLVTTEDGNKWMYKNKDHGMLSAAASLGMIHLWDVDGGLTPIDKYLYTSEEHIKAGALLALGLVNCGVRNECDPALALLSDYVLHSSANLRIGSILGLGIAYAGTQREDVLSHLLPALADTSAPPEICALAAVACGLIAVGSCNGDVTCAIIQRLIDDNKDLHSSTYARFLHLGLGLCFLGCKERTEATMAALEVLPEPQQSLCQTTLSMCAYAGTGDVLVVQQMLHICSKHYDTDNEQSSTEDTAFKKQEKKESKEGGSGSGSSSSGSKDDKNKSKSKESKSKDKEKEKEKEANKELSSVQAVATLGVAVIALAEETGAEMCTRIFGQLGRYGEPAVRRAVPLAIALCSVSNPQLSVIDVLNKYSHDADNDVAYNAIFAMGLVGAGTNNARLATMLRALALYHGKSPVHLFMVRLAQGLCHAGKGTVTLCPAHSDRRLLNQPALAGLLVVLTAFLDCKNIILGKSHYLLYVLATAMQPRWLVTLDENLQPLNVSVRVGQAVDVIGKAGTPKTIAGSHTHTTPVLLSFGERAELATDEYIPLSPVMEGFVILKKNEDSVMASVQ
ncbi:26S proteasome non-ATPase regulatory subunit 2 [Danaus plexippus]|uniref:26S proteasome non-ATPase regulatory subunit 2 n=1 Tax=Danaus plexippus TaxID=13037 RepID=UPI0013C3E69F|nr:26S proteasome non-ATPase regulatory subunit 2 [Danaus plexippus plexippus]XP_061383643.1 26S proteasome non-ATPase regulatory subunit 2 [Danaus plexippus]